MTNQAVISWNTTKLADGVFVASVTSFIYGEPVKILIQRTFPTRAKAMTWVKSAMMARKRAAFA